MFPSLFCALLIYLSLCEGVTKTKLIENEWEETTKYTDFTGHHGSTGFCNDWSTWSFVPWDSVLATCSTVLFYCLLWPYAHMLLRCFAPGLPRITKVRVIESRAELLIIECAHA